MMMKCLAIVIAAAIMLSGYPTLQEPKNALVSQASGYSKTKPGMVSALVTNENVLSDSILESYYLSSDEPVFSYLQNNSIQRFLNMWVSYHIDEDLKVRWNYDTLAPVTLLDHDFNAVGQPGDGLYTCTFTSDDGRCGYIIVSYDAKNPSISKWSLHETTPYMYDLKTNSEQIAAALLKTDLDLSTAVAARIEWIDTDKNKADSGILFTDAKNDEYICYLDDNEFTVEKQ